MGLLRSIKLILTLSCDQSTELVSSSLDRKLAWNERWAVRLHAICCWSCRRFRRQILFLRQASQRPKMVEIVNLQIPGNLSTDARERIQQRLRDELSNRESE